MQDFITITPIDNATQAAPIAPIAPFKVDVSRGSRNGSVSSQWFARPADQRFTSVNALYDAVRQRSNESHSTIIDTRAIRVHASPADPDRLSLILPDDRADGSVTVDPSHYAFGQTCGLLGVPAGYLRKLPATIVGINLQYAVNHFRAEQVKAYVRVNGCTELRAMTGPEYGRIFDHELVAGVRKIAGDGRGDTRWKIPGVLNWRDSTYDPEAEITEQSTTLFASDRDVFLFLVDDRNPIEVGKLADGTPDLMFRGFYAWNSEVGARTFGLATMLLRGVCMNRNLWGVEQFSELKIRHSKGAPERFAIEALPALERMAESATGPIIRKIGAAKSTIVANNDDERREFLQRRGFTQSETSAALAACLATEDHPATSVWDMVQGITAAARNEGHQDERVSLEQRAGKLMDKVHA
jgi:hypothetical protein